MTMILMQVVVEDLVEMARTQMVVLTLLFRVLAVLLMVMIKWFRSLEVQVGEVAVPMREMMNDSEVEEEVEEALY